MADFYTYKNAVQVSNLNESLLRHFGAKLTTEEKKRLRDIRTKWNFYEGYHWEDMPDNDKPQVTFNYCRAFVNKFVSFELSKGFTIKMEPKMERLGEKADDRGDEDKENDPLDFLNHVWDSNNKQQKCLELGQSKGVTGEAWIQVHFESPTINGKPNPDYEDPFGENPKGRIRILVVPTAISFPKYDDGYDKDKLTAFEIMYPIEKEVPRFGGLGSTMKTVIYRQVYTKDRIMAYEGDELKYNIPNKIGTIPFRQIKNIPQVGKENGQSDIEDLIPMNVELNMKRSDVSEIIDYHAAPITVVFGARIGQLERGANKVWGGLPKDAKIQNLELSGDLTASISYIDGIKQAMHEIGHIPVGALGGELKISNTSSLALQIALSPLLERISDKQVMTKEGIQYINKLILLTGLKEGLIKKPEGIDNSEFYYNEVTFETALPKDIIVEMQQIEQEITMGLEDRRGAMNRLGKDNIEFRIREIDKDRKENPAIYGLDPVTGLPIKSAPKQPGINADGNQKKTNSGVTNSSTPSQNPNSH